MSRLVNLINRVSLKMVIISFVGMIGCVIAILVQKSSQIPVVLELATLVFAVASLVSSIAYGLQREDQGQRRSSHR